MRFAMAVPMLMLLGACASRQVSPAADVALNVAPVDLSTISASASRGTGYRIGAADKLSVTVFQVPDLSLNGAVVDPSGNLQLPLLGLVRAEGLTPAELSQQIEVKLADKYVRNPRVTVTVSEAASQKVTVDGAVTKPGVYEMQGRTSLIQAVAMAEGPMRTANIGRVAVFRTVDGRRMVALFDLAAIRAGQLEDPVVYGDDVIVVDTSRLNAALRDIVAALPGVAAFAYF